MPRAQRENNRAGGRAGAKRPAHAPEGRISDSQVGRAGAKRPAPRAEREHALAGWRSEPARAAVAAALYGDLLRDTASASSGGREAAGTKLEPLALVQHVDLLEFSLGLREVQDALDDGDDPDHP